MSGHEIDPFALERRDAVLREVTRAEKDTPQVDIKEVQKLIPGAQYIYAVHTNNVIPQVEALVEKYGNFENFPQDSVNKLAYHFGDQPAMIKALALVIAGEDKKL